MSLKGQGDCDGDIDNLGMYTVLPWPLPDMILASIIWLASLVIISLVPLHSPSFWSKFLNNIIGEPTLSLILGFGRPEVDKEFRNSIVIMLNPSLSIVSDFSIESELRYSSLHLKE